MEAKDTVMSVREIAALLRGMPYHPSNEAGWMNFVRRCLNAQAEITWKAREPEIEAARKAGVKEVVKDFETVLDAPSRYRLGMFYDILDGWQAKPSSKNGV